LLREPRLVPAGRGLALEAHLANVREAPWIPTAESDDVGASAQRGSYDRAADEPVGPEHDVSAFGGAGHQFLMLSAAVSPAPPARSHST